MYGVAIGGWGGYWEGSPFRSLRPQAAAAAKSEGSTLGKGAILGAMPLQEHSAWEQIVSWDGTSDGVCQWAQLCSGCEQRAKMVSYWQ